MADRTDAADINSKIIGIVSDRLDIPKEKITPQSRYVADLGADSIASVELIMAIEEALGVEIDSGDAATLQTIQNTVDYVSESLSGVEKKPKVAETQQVSSGILGFLGSPIPQSLVKAAAQSFFKAFHHARLEGLENLADARAGKPTIIVANHATFYDAPFLAAMLPFKPAFPINRNTHTRFMREKWYYRMFADKMDLYPIDIQNPHSLKDLIKVAQAGQPVMIFPEATLAGNIGQIDEVLKGTAMLADQTGADIVPIYLDGFRFLKYGVPQSVKDAFPKRKTFAKLWGQVGEPIKLDIPENLKGRARQEVAVKQITRVMQGLPANLGNTDRSLFEAFCESADKYGHGRHIMDGIDKSDVKYMDLLRGGYVLGGELAKRTGPGEFVGFITANTVAQTAAILGAWSAGRVPAMLNPAADIDTLKSCINTAKIKRIVTLRAFIEKAKTPEDKERFEKMFVELSKTCEIIYLEDIRQEIDKKSLYEKAMMLQRYKKQSAGVLEAVSGNDPAVILFTSGTTGAPKGVVLSHQNILANAAQVIAIAPFKPGHVVMNSLPGFHAFGLCGGTLLPLLTGMKSYQYPSPLDYKEIIQLIHFSKANVVFTTNTFLRNTLKSAEPGYIKRLEYIFTGAERGTEDVYALCADITGRVPLQGYGMTEASPLVSVNMPGAHRKGTVGRILPSMDYKLVDIPGLDKGQELRIKGPNVMLGYLMPDNPGVIQSSRDEYGYHPTDDIVTIDKDGYVTIHGRSKRLVKFGGEYVQLELLEQFAQAASSKLAPEIPDGQYEHAVVGFKDMLGNEATALFTTHRGLARQHLLHAAGERTLGLPKDADIIVLEDLPKLPTGKPDFTAMQRMVQNRIA